MATYLDIFKLILVGFFWGATNPFIKRGTQGIENVTGSNQIHKTINEIIFLITNIKYLIPFVINQMGSVLYYFTLGSSDLTLAVPAANSMAFIFTALTGWALKEEMPDKGSLIGMSLVTLGIGCFFANSILYK